jgi:hypothetical protein
VLTLPSTISPDGANGASAAAPRASSVRHALPLLVRALPLFVSALALLAPLPADAASALRVPRDLVAGNIAASTYDESGKRVGPASMRVEHVADGHVRIEATSGFTGAEQTTVSALLEPTADGKALRPVWQESRSLNAAGEPLGVLMVDHARGVGTCTPSDGSAPEQVKLGANDRVANVVVSQLLGPLVAARAGSFDFAILICRPDARIVTARAEVVGTAPTVAAGAAGADEANGANGELVEVETAVDLGPVLGRLLAPFLPRVSMWFDPQDAQDAAAWIGQRMPLFSKGPTVLVLRSGVSPARVLSR